MLALGGNVTAAVRAMRMKSAAAKESFGHRDPLAGPFLKIKRAMR
jgi:hypothetical protein